MFIIYLEVLQDAGVAAEPAQTASPYPGSSITAATFVSGAFVFGIHTTGDAFVCNTWIFSSVAVAAPA
ncbi:hypothetical protein FVF58_45765 [Paraburkholderia panacisoli]|uniref:Uncharacterized protein n=1 Tax=Paraburkholderia panacisoli TaxID=2603818 RepID=A0A5B0G6A1_9BURK|nr:hypothetical protein [Paraburkholderia panacisoli]KAA0998195.1 hypothetical protein FVF58_45765 [Paraburkholderia panacisoli]